MESELPSLFLDGLRYSHFSGGSWQRQRGGEGQGAAPLMAARVVRDERTTEEEEMEKWKLERMEKWRNGKPRLRHDYCSFLIKDS